MGQGQEVHARRSMQQSQQGVSIMTKSFIQCTITLLPAGRMGIVTELSLVS